MRPGTLSIGFGSPRQRSGTRESTITSSVEARRELVRLDRVVGSLARGELRRLDLLVAAAKRTAPRLEVDHRALVVAEVPQQPPEPLGAAHAPVRDDEDPVADARARRRGGELLRSRQRMPATRSPRRGEVAVDVEERRAGYVTREIGQPSGLGIRDLPAAVDEAVVHGRSILDAVRRTPLQCGARCAPRPSISIIRFTVARVLTR